MRKQKHGVLTVSGAAVGGSEHYARIDRITNPSPSHRHPHVPLTPPPCQPPPRLRRDAACPRSGAPDLGTHPRRPRARGAGQRGGRRRVSAERGRLPLKPWERLERRLRSTGLRVP
eukprot:5276691-Prymnesium_polylepis.2